MSDNKPRFLAPLGKPRDYVDRPELSVRDEPECIGPAIVDGYAEIAAFHRSHQHTLDVMAMRQMRPLLRAEDRLKDAERRAKQARRRDLKGEFVALRGMLSRFQRGGEEPKPGSSVLNRLERVEAKLDGLDQAA